MKKTNNKKTNKSVVVAPVIESGRGHKKPISQSSFNKSTNGGVFRKGFLSYSALKDTKTALTDYTLQFINDFMKKQKIAGAMLFIRDKNLVMVLDTKNKKVFYSDKLTQYSDYFIAKNTDWKSEKLGNCHPANLHSRGAAVVSVAKSNGFTL